MNPARFPVKEYRAETRDVPVAADTFISHGVMVALNRSGQAVPAADAAGLSILGSADGPAGSTRGCQDVDGRGHKGGVKVVHVKMTLCRYLNSSSSPVTAADFGRIVFVEDERTVAKRSRHGVQAGVAIGLVGAAYVWLFVGPPGTVPGSVALGAE